MSAVILYRIDSGRHMHRYCRMVDGRAARLVWRMVSYAGIGPYRHGRFAAFPIPPARSRDGSSATIPCQTEAGLFNVNQCHARRPVNQRNGDVKRAITRRRPICRTATLFTIDKPAKGEQDFMHPSRFPVRQVLWGFSHETNQHGGSNSLCVPGIRGVGSAETG
jgi:hypothetical protein